MALRKCALCGEPIQKEESALPYKKRYVHEHCFKASMNAIKKDKDNQLQQKEKQRKNNNKVVTSRKSELKEGLSEEEYKEKKAYYDYLRSLNVDINAKVYVLSDKYISQYAFTWIGLYQTLVYLHEIIAKELTGEVVGLLPYYYNEAMSYFAEIDKIRENNANVDTQHLYQNKVLRLNANDINKSKIKQIDITTII